MKISHTKTNIFALTSLSFLLGACVLLFGMWFFLISKARTLDEALTNAAVREAEENQLASFSQLLENTAEDRILLKSFVLVDTEVINFISHLESVAQSKGLSIKINSVATSPIEGSTAFETLNLDLQIIGNKKEVMGLVSYIEHMPYQTMLRRFILERIDDSEEWSATFGVQVTKVTPHE